MEAARRWWSRYALIVFLLILPVAFGVHDIVATGGVTRIAENLKDGISNGAIWALVAIGYTLVYGIIELINFAHGDVFMIGSLVSTGLWGTLGLTLTTGTGGLIPGLILSLIIAMIASGSLNVLIERVGYRPLRGAPKLAPLITAVGFSVVVQNVVLLWIDGFRAGLIAFTAAVMGGIGNVYGAVLGGLIIGCIQQISDNRLGGQWTNILVFGYLVAIMVLRPRGLLGEETREAG